LSTPRITSWNSATGTPSGQTCPNGDRIEQGDYDQVLLVGSLRDALLPKLISGELRVKDAEKFINKRGL